MVSGEKPIMYSHDVPNEGYKFKITPGYRLTVEYLMATTAADLSCVVVDVILDGCKGQLTFPKSADVYTPNDKGEATVYRIAGHRTKFYCEDHLKVRLFRNDGKKTSGPVVLFGSLSK